MINLPSFRSVFTFVIPSRALSGTYRCSMCALMTPSYSFLAEEQVKSSNRDFTCLESCIELPDRMSSCHISLEFMETLLESRSWSRKPYKGT
jgi:hypothetical protein